MEKYFFILSSQNKKISLFDKRGKDSYFYTSFFGAIAQLGERLNGIQKVSGSIPLSSTIKSLEFSGLLF